MRPRRGSSEVRAHRMKCSATPAPVMNHLWPWITQRSPFFSARVRIMPGSEPPPGAGSVIAKAERTLPSTIGRSHRSFCAGVPTSASRFILPSSGAAQLKHTGPKIERFASSYIAAQPTMGSAMPPNSFGACGAQRPAAFAFARTRSSRSSRIDWQRARGRPPGQHARTQRDSPRAHRHEHREYNWELLGQHRHPERDTCEAAHPAIHRARFHRAPLPGHLPRCQR